jgi:twitching motility protein PilU
MQGFEQYLEWMVQQKASDLFFSVGAPPAMKIEGHLIHLGDGRLASAQVRDTAYALMTEKQQRDFEAALEMNFALQAEGIGRFRVNIYRQRGEVAMVVRHIRAEIPGIASLNLPERLEQLVMLPRGLVLVVGATGSGKSTTLAAMIDYRNRNRSGHILTVEEPIEFVHEHRRSIVDQREIGLDTWSYDNALKNAMREAPDAILIGEIRDREVMQHALAYAQTGHLCLTTLHANNASQAMERILNFFPESAHRQLIADLAASLQAVVSMRLIPGTAGCRVPAVELLLRTPYVADLIAEREFEKLKEAMKQGVDEGMQCFDEALYRLHVAGRISYEEAIANADSRTDLALRIRLNRPAGSAGGLALEGEGRKTPP